MQSGMIPTRDERLNGNLPFQPTGGRVSKNHRIQREITSWIISADGDADLANDVDEISSLEGQLIWLVRLAIP